MTPSSLENSCSQSLLKENKKCPFSINKSDNTQIKSLKVSFEPILNESVFSKYLSLAKEMYQRISPASLKSAWYVGSNNDVSKAFLKAWKKGSFVSDFASLTGTVYVTADPIIMKAIFTNSRKEALGTFHDYENKRIFVEGILQDLYPEDIQKIGKEKAVDMLVISAATPHASALRGPMIKALGPNAISNYLNELKNIADSILEALNKEEKLNCEANVLAFEYAVTVISKIFTGYDAARNDYQSLGRALDAFSSRMSRIISHKPPTKEEQKDYHIAVSVMKKVIENCLKEPSPYIKGLIDAGWNEFQIKANLFFLYFAGTETTASLINYLLWQLGREENNHLQNEIRKDSEKQTVLLKTIAEGLRLHPPAFVEGRQLREDTWLIVKDKNENLILKKRLAKNHSIVCLTQAAGQDPIIYNEPQKFNPYRFKEDDLKIAALSFMPFGGGPHICPGQHLALAELQIFISRILHHYSIKTLQPKELEQKGFFTLRAASVTISAMNLMR